MKIGLLVAVLCVSAEVALAGPSAVWPGNGHTYELVEENISWLSAYSTAAGKSLEGNPGYLASVTSQPEQDFIFNTFNRPGLHAIWIGLTSAPALGGAGNPGIGGSGAPYWVWTSGEPTGYVNWVKAENGYGYNEPNNYFGIDDYTELVFTNTDGTPGRWNDTPSDYFDGNNRYFLVEYNTVIPEPSSSLLVFAALATWLCGWRFVGHRVYGPEQPLHPDKHRDAPYGIACIQGAAPERSAGNQFFAKRCATLEIASHVGQNRSCVFRGTGHGGRHVDEYSIRLRRVAATLAADQRAAQGHQSEPSDRGSGPSIFELARAS